MEYNINLCRICQNPDNLDLVNTSTATDAGETYLDLLKFIFNDIVWIEDHLISVLCKVCLEKIKDASEFKTLCLESTRRRAILTVDPIKLEIQKIKHEIEHEDLTADDDYCGPEIGEPPRRTKNELTSIIDDDSPQEEVSMQKRKRRKKKVHVDTPEELYFKKSTKSNIKRKRKGKSAITKRQVKRKIVTSSDDEDEKDECTKTNINNEKISKNTVKENQDDDDCFEEMDFKENDMKALSLYIPQYAPTPLEDTCRRCKVKFSNYEKLKEHVNSTHLKLRRYHCDKCQEGFISKDLLERHNYKHDGIRKHVCTICGSKYITQGDLRHHLDRHVDEAKFACDICPDKKYKTLNSLRSHKQLVHIDPKDFKYLCPECGKKFPQSSGLKVHMLRIHANVRSFVCQLCEKTFCTKGEMVTHQKTHTNVRDFKCELCGAEYKHKDQMLLHQTKVHGIGNHKIRPNEKYECRYCSKIISSKDKLKRHIRTHTGVKPFKCRLCEMNFTCKSYVRCHVKRKHNIDVDASDFNIKSYCEVCEDAFLEEEEVGGNLLPTVEERN